MNVPNWVYVMLTKKFTAAEAVVIDANWHTFAQISFSNSTHAELIKTAKMVLACSKLHA